MRDDGVRVGDIGEVQGGSGCAGIETVSGHLVNMLVLNN
jgi:hypothetical protein